jgi:hypothetical protein
MTSFAGPLLPLLLLLTCAAAAGAQTDYYNTDAGRPIVVEDARPLERRALELQVAPLRLERAARTGYSWEIEPEIAYGILPRTHIEVGVPVLIRDRSRGAGDFSTVAAPAGIELAALHALNVETSWPALAIATEVLLPAGGFGPRAPFVTGKGIATRTFSGARLHANAAYTFGKGADAGAEELSRWLIGVAADRTWPLESLLLTGEVVARQPIHEEEAVRWSTAVGARYQLSPRLALDAGLGRTMTGPERSWWVTFGSAYSLGVPWWPR